MTEETATNPVEGEDTSPAPGVVEAEDTDLDTNDGLEPEAEDGEGEEDDDSEEVDLDGQKYRVPKALKPALMMHADYTRKTQEVAAARQALETERQTLAQQAEVRAAFVEDHAQVLALKAQIDAYSEVDFDAWLDQDPIEAQKALQRLHKLERAHSEAQSGLQTKMQQRASDEQQETAKRIREGYAQLPTVIPGFTPELEREIASYGRSAGFTPQELAEAVADPRNIKVLHLAMIGAKSLQQQQTAKKLAKQQDVQPAKVVGGKTPTSTSKVDDRLSTEEWMRRRTAQARKRA